MLKFSIFQPVKRLEIKLGKDISYKELGAMMKLDGRTVGAFMDGTVSRIDLPSLEKVLLFFAREGMPVTIGDLFVVTDSESDATP